MQFTRLICAPVALVAGMAIGASTAHADAIAYIDGGNVWVASADGSVKKQLTTNATADVWYHGPSQADNGTLSVIFGRLARGAAQMQVLDASGVMKKTGLLQMQTCGAVGQFPSALGSTRMDPAGEVIAYDYLCTDTGPGGGSNVYTALTSAANPGGIFEELRYTGAYQPSWLSRRGGTLNDMLVTDRGGQTLSILRWAAPVETTPVV